MTMQREQAEQKESEGATTSRRPYRRPEIRRLGTVQELTLSGGSVDRLDATLVMGKTTA
jgi:hypothetical protein